MKKDSIVIDGVEFITRNAVMEMLKISSVTLWNWTRSGKLRCHAIGNREYFLESEICEDIKKCGQITREKEGK